MTSLLRSLLIVTTCAAGAFPLGCSSSTPGTTGPGSAQTPPTNGTDVETWLKTGDYKQWHCEAAPHAGRSPTIHGVNRICSNDLINANATGTGNWPSGAAAVKELYATATDTTPGGYSVYLKTQGDSAGGASWYFYERLPGSGVFADGMGSSGVPKATCVVCHGAAGSDAAHTPSPGGRDFVYTPVH